RVGRDESKRDLLAVRRCRNLEAYFLLRREWIHRLQPSLRAADLADMADGGKLPQRFLPRFDPQRQRGRITGFRRAPARAQTIEKQGRLITRQLAPKRAEILRVQTALASHGLYAFALSGQIFALGERGGEVLFQRQPSALVGVEHDP